MKACQFKKRSHESLFGYQITVPSGNKFQVKND